MAVPELQEGVGKLIWQKYTKMAGAYKERLKDVALLERKAQTDLRVADTCLERSYRSNGAKLCSVEMARTRSNRHRLCLGSFKVTIREKNVTRMFTARRGSRVSTHGDS